MFDTLLGLASGRAAVFALTLLVAGAAAADPPGRVGRISYIEGAAAFLSGSPAPEEQGQEQDDWTAAQVNYPVTSGDALWTEPDARLELQIGPAAVRMDQSTEIDILRLDDDAIDVRVDQGAINVHLRALPAGGIAVSTARGRVELLQPGTYHIDTGDPAAGAAAETIVTTLAGEARLSAARAQLQILPGESAVLSGEPLAFAVTRGHATAFDDWALGRERREVAAESTRYLSPETTGYEDLDAYGQWHSDADYGPIWYPTSVAADWAPYRDGRWAYVAPWGWTWVDSAPWGFAPFHYGRWVYARNAWGWCPGTRVARPVYAPALVAFIGGSRWSVGIDVGGPAVGWVPLGPREVFHPYYRTSANYIRNVNITHVHNYTVINNTNSGPHQYRNRRGATVVAADTFTRARPVRGAALHVSPAQLAQAQVMPNPGDLRPDGRRDRENAGFRGPTSARRFDAAPNGARGYGGTVQTPGQYRTGGMPERNGDRQRGRGGEAGTLPAQNPGAGIPTRSNSQRNDTDTRNGPWRTVVRPPQSGATDIPTRTRDADFQRPNSGRWTQQREPGASRTPPQRTQQPSGAIPNNGFERSGQRAPETRGGMQRQDYPQRTAPTYRPAPERMQQRPERAEQRMQMRESPSQDRMRAPPQQNQIHMQAPQNRTAPQRGDYQQRERSNNRERNSGN